MIRPTIISVVAGLVSITQSMATFANNTQTTVFLVPFQIETYMPVTRQTIECDALEKWVLAKESHAAHLTDLLRDDVDVKFDEQRVRAKIVMPSSVIYIDSNGTAIRGEKLARVDVEQFTATLSKLGASRTLLRRNGVPECKTGAGKSR